MIGLLLAVTLAFESPAGCDADQAQVTFVPPETMRVVLIEQCGAITCWTRWLDVDGKRVGVSRACEAGHGGASSGNNIEVIGGQR